MNHGKHHIHGGFEGLHKQVWQADIDAKKTLRLNYISQEGESGYPGEVRIEVTYTLTDENELAISYRAWTNRLTPLNLTNHTYFNLGGEGSGSILDHECRIFAEAYHPIDKELIPTGAVASVAGTPFDFRTSAGIGSRIGTRDTQLERADGYDHNYILNNRGSAAPAAVVCDLSSGRCLELFTDRPGLQFYSGNFLDGSQMGKSGKPYGRRTGFCLEAQDFPNSLNQSGFPSILISPDAPYSAFCAYRLAKI
jgi:aldose 1-epimerase